MKTLSVTPFQWLALFVLTVTGAGPGVNAQPTAELGIQAYAGLSITGAVGMVYSVECVTDLTQTNNSTAWQCLEFVQLPATPYLWVDKTAPMTSRRFYRAVEFAAPTNMVFIIPGTYLEGSPTNEQDRFPSEGPQTAVIITRGFWMGTYEVTQAEYQSLMGTNPSYFNGGTYGVDLQRPVDRVSWDDAVGYCEAFTQKHLNAGLIPRGARYRLPTAAEWQYACRAWTSTRFSYGDDPNYTDLAKYAWYLDNSSNMTHAVGQKLPNPWGLYDMHGNVWEWCQDWYQGWYPWLPGGIVVDPQGPTGGSSRRVGGGAWLYAGRECRSAVINNYLQDWRRDGQIGFRIVLSQGL